MHTVICTKNKSEIYCYTKDALVEVSKQNQHIIDKFKLKWRQFVDNRIQSYLESYQGMNREAAMLRNVIQRPHLQIANNRPFERDPIQVSNTKDKLQRKFMVESKKLNLIKPNE